MLRKLECSSLFVRFATPIAIALFISGCASSPALIWSRPGYQAWAKQHVQDPSKATPGVDGFPPAGLSEDEQYSAFREANVIFSFLAPPPSKESMAAVASDTLTLVAEEGPLDPESLPWFKAARERYIVTGVLETSRSDSEHAYHQHIRLIERAKVKDGFLMSKPPQVSSTHAISYFLRSDKMPRPSMFN